MAVGCDWVLGAVVVDSLCHYHSSGYLLLWLLFIVILFGVVIFWQLVVHSGNRWLLAVIGFWARWLLVVCVTTVAQIIYYSEYIIYCNRYIILLCCLFYYFES